MSAPTKNTAPEIQIYILRDMVDWHTNHEQLLEFMLGINYKGSQKAEKLAVQLEQIEKLYQANIREDVDATSNKQTTIANTQQFLSSVAIVAKHIFKDDPKSKKIYRHFLKEPPSRARSAHLCDKALTRTINAIERYRAKLDETHPRSERLINRAKSLKEELGHVTKSKSTENQETENARRDRNEKIEEVMDFIRESKMASMSV